MTNKKITKKKVNARFKTIGLALIIYIFFVLYIPLLLKELFIDQEIGLIFGLSKKSILNALIVVAGTVLPFKLMDKALFGKNDKKEKIEIPFGEIFIQSLMLFTISSVTLFLTSTIFSYFGKSADLVGGIGVVIDGKIVDDIVYTLLFVLITPIIEEFAFRAVLLRYLSRFGKYFALVATSLIFALAHSSFIEIFPAFIMSYELGKIYLRYKSAKPCIWIHGLYNLTLYILLIIPGKYSIFVAIFLALIYVASFVLFIAKKYTFIRVTKAKSTWKVFLIFFSRPEIILSVMLMIVQTALTMLLA